MTRRTHDAWILMMDCGWVHKEWFKTRKLARAQKQIFQTSPFVKENYIRIVKIRGFQHGIR